MTTPEIAGPAGVLTEARFAAEQTGAGHAEATEATSRIAARIVALDAERAEIANARMAGVDDPRHVQPPARARPVAGVGPNPAQVALRSASPRACGRCRSRRRVDQAIR